MAGPSSAFFRSAPPVGAAVVNDHPPDFVDAHRRHWEDGNLLCDHDRRANAAHLFGLSAECGLKAVMQALKWMSLDLEGKLRERGRRKHIQDIWPLFSDLARDRDGGRYGLAGSPMDLATLDGKP